MSFLIVIIVLGALLIFTQEGRMFYLATFKPDDPLLRPDSEYLVVVESREDVKIFNSTYSNIRGGTLVRFHDRPYAVTYSSVDGWTPVDIGKPLPPRSDRTFLALGINATNMEVKIITLYCSYLDDTYEIRDFVVSGGNVLRYLQEANNEKCWNLPPPEYRDLLELRVADYFRSSD